MKNHIMLDNVVYHCCDYFFFDVDDKYVVQIFEYVFKKCCINTKILKSNWMFVPIGRNTVELSFDYYTFKISQRMGNLVIQFWSNFIHHNLEFEIDKTDHIASYGINNIYVTLTKAKHCRIERERLIVAPYK